MPPAVDISDEDYVSQMRRKLHETHGRVRVKLQQASDRMKTVYDRNAADGGYKSGDQVWLFSPYRKKGLSPKLQKQWTGPCIVLTRINDLIYRIKKPDGKRLIVHYNRLAPYRCQQPPCLDVCVRDETP